jgi:hypothetical protein
VLSGQASVRLVLLMLLAFIALLNVAVMRVLVATPVTTGTRAKGAVALTLGTSAMPPFKPRMGSLPPPQAVIASVETRASNQPEALMQEDERRMKRLLL